LPCDCFQDLKVSKVGIVAKTQSEMRMPTQLKQGILVLYPKNFLRNSRLKSPLKNHRTYAG
jgi:hypothetical protein